MRMTPDSRNTLKCREQDDFESRRSTDAQIMSHRSAKNLTMCSRVGSLSAKSTAGRFSSALAGWGRARTV